MRGRVHVCITPTYQVGDPPPPGYLEWHEWAKVQHAGGLRQRVCGACSLWRFPQELSGRVITGELTDRHGALVRVDSPICKACARSRS